MICRDSIRFWLLFLIFSAGCIFKTIAQRKPIYTERSSTSARAVYPSNITVITNYVDGYVKILGNAKFIVPVGDNGRYRPFATAADGVLGAYFFCNPTIAISTNIKGGNYPPLPFGAPFPTSAKDNNVGKVSTKEYWDINGTLATRITLTWNAESGIAALLDNGSLSKLFIVGWNGTKWVKIPSTIDVNALLGGQSNLTTGSVTTTSAIVPFTYNVYTFAADITTMPPPTARIGSKDSTNLNAVTDTFVAQVAPFDDSKELNQANINDDLIVYPNPARDQIFIKTNDNKQVRKVTIYDLSGRKLLQADRLPYGRVDITKLDPGIYFIHLLGEGGKMTRKKFVVAN